MTVSESDGGDFIVSRVRIGSDLESDWGMERVRLPPAFFCSGLMWFPKEVAQLKRDGVDYLSLAAARGEEWIAG